MTSHRILVVLLFLWCAAIAVTPMLSSGGGFPSQVAGASYAFFSHVCHQFDSCSFHVDGYKFPVCIRCMSIYASFFVGVLCFPAMKRVWQRELPAAKLLAVAVIPMVADVSFSLCGIHESNDWTRLVTGAVFGLISSFVLAPILEDAIRLLLVRTVTGRTSAST